MNEVAYTTRLFLTLYPYFSRTHLVGHGILDDATGGSPEDHKRATRRSYLGLHANLDEERSNNHTTTDAK